MLRNVSWIISIQKILINFTLPDDPELPDGVKEYGSSSEDPDAKNLFLGSELLRIFAPLPFDCCARPWEL